MSDAARKNTQALELGCVTKLFVEALPLGDVLHDELNTEQGAVFGSDRRIADQPVSLCLRLRCRGAMDFAIEDRFPGFEHVQMQRLDKGRQLGWKYLPNRAPEVRCHRLSIDDGE